MATLGSADYTNELLQQASKLTGIAPQTFTNQPNQTEPITSASLSGSGTSVQFNPPATPDATGLNTSIPTPEAIINQAATPTAAEAEQTRLLQSIAGETGGQQGLTTLTNQAEQAGGVPDLNAKFNEYVSQLEGLNNQATALQNEAQYTIPNAAQVSAEGRGITAGGLAPITASQLRMNQIKQGAIATQSLTIKSLAYAAQGKLMLAKDAAEKAAKAQYEQQQIKLDALRANLDVLTPTLNQEEKKRALTLQAQLDERQRTLDWAREDKKVILGWAALAQQNGASSLQASEIAKANDIDTAFRLYSPFAKNPQEAEMQKLELSTMKAQNVVAWANANKATTTPETYEVPTVKSINGVDMQWNPKTAQWETIGAGPSAKVEDTKSQLQFLRDTTTKAKELSGAASRSGVRNLVQDWLIGTNKYNQLQAVSNTLKVNVLSLMTDPNIKKFFGPQMSNADVLLMTSSGTTLNPAAQSPAQLKEEVQRLDDLFNRMQTAVLNGASTGNVITAPDGTQIEITD